jgi:hypothetical protein
MHNVFHISLFRPYIEGKSPRSPPIPEVIKGEFEFIVQRIMKFRMVMVKTTEKPQRSVNSS